MTESRASRTSEMSRGGVRPSPNSVVDSKKVDRVEKVGQVGEVYEALSQPGM